MEMRCHKSKFAAQAEKWGWLELYDRLKDDGSEISYLLPDGSSVMVGFNSNAEFKSLNDAGNAAINIDGDESENDG